VPEQTNHYYYNKYIIYNKKNNTQNDPLPPLLCYSMRVVLRSCHYVRVPEHAGTRWNTGTRMVLFLSVFAAVLPPWWCCCYGIVPINLAISKLP
jgi:hypothetical protein